MKRLLFILSLLTFSIPATYAGKWDFVRVIAMHPEESLSIGGFLIGLFLLCIPVGIVAGIVSLILKSVFDLDKDDTQKAFLTIGGILLAICLLISFLA